jgi:PAS domain S-box-containing protein
MKENDLLKLLEKALDTVNPFIAIKDENGVYIYANDKVNQEYKDRFETIIRKHYSEIYPLEEQEIVAKLDQEAIDNKAEIHKTISIYTDSGYKYVDISRAPVFDDEGNLVAVISAGMDVTEREKLKLERETLIDQLQKLDKENQELLHTDSLTNIGN